MFTTFMRLLLFLFLSSPLFAQSWPQWRGPNRDGVAQAVNLPTVLPDNLTLLWQVNAGAGVSSPVISGNQIYLLTRDGDDEVASCYNSTKGDLIWQKRYSAKFIANPQADIPRWFPGSKGKGPFSTPLFHNNRLYTLGVDRIFSCFDAKTGELKWQHHYFPTTIPDKLTYECPPCGCSEDGNVFAAPGKCTACQMTFSAMGLETSATSIGNYYGAVASPVVAKDQVIIHVGNNKQGIVIAHDLASGEKIWEWKGPAIASSSPVIAEIHGISQLVSITRVSVFGISVDTGELLWEFPIENNAQIVTPIVSGNLVIFAEYRRPIRAIETTKSEDVWTAREVWDNSELTLWTSTAVLDGKQLYGFFYSSKGQFCSVDIHTGKTHWQSEGRQGAAASLISAGKYLFALKENADLIVIDKKENAFFPLKTYSVAESPTWSHPVLWDNKILIKDVENLTLWEIQ